MGSIAPYNPVADWVAKPTGDHFGNYYDLVSGAAATVTRTTPKTIYDPNTGRIHDVPAGSLAINPWSAYQAGGSGYAAVIEEARTNSYLRSYFDLDTNADGLSDGWLYGTGVTGSRTAGAVYGTQQTVSYVGQAGDVNATVNLIYQDGLTGVATNAVTTSSYRSSVSVGVTAVQRFIEAHDAAHAVLGTFVAAITDTPIPTRGSGTYAALPASTAHVCSGVRATGVDTGDTVTVTMQAAQNEVGAFATSYIPTTTAAVTRNTDSVVVPTTGLSMGEGSLAVLSAPSAGAAGYVFSWRISASNAVTAYKVDQIYMTVTADAALKYDGVNYAQGVFAGRWKTGEQVRASINGTLGVRTDVAALPTGAAPATAYVGTVAGLTQAWNGAIARLALYATALTDAQLQSAQLTTDFLQGYRGGNMAAKLLAIGVL